MPPATVLVRYWAAARAAAGVDSETVPVESGVIEGAPTELGTGAGSGPARGTVGAVLDAAVSRHPDLAPVLAVASILVDGRARSRGAVLGEASVVEILPPFAGG